MSRRCLFRFVLPVSLFVMIASHSPGAPVELRCEYLKNPLGIDATKPSLSWQSDSTERDWKQTAYRIRVVSKQALLNGENADVWDSGRKESGESVNVRYDGPALESKKRYYWSVQVWDRNGHDERSRETAWWEMGLLQPSDWKAQWIGRDNPDDAADRKDLRWIWVKGADAKQVMPGTEALFRLNVKLAKVPERAALFLIARGDWSVKVNGKDAGTKPHWNAFDRRELTGLLVAGQNEIEISVKCVLPQSFGSPVNKGPRPAALAALLKIERADGKVERFASPSHWQAKLQGEDPWSAAQAAADFSDKDFGGDPGPFPQPAALLRKQFSVQKQVVSARAYLTALGAYKSFLNGKALGKGVLTPGFTQFDKRVQYQTYDVSSLVVPGKNVWGVVLGDGWFASPLSWTGLNFSLKPPTRVLGQLQIEYSDGTRDVVVSGSDWKASSSPILMSQIYAGEVYDGRLEKTGWGEPGFSDDSWEKAAVREPYLGMISAQPDLLPAVQAELKPERITPRPDGTYVLDMGQNMVGFAKLTVSGKSAAQVRLRFAEILNPDGSIYTTNLRNADATDFYTLRGSGQETFTPSFTFHGFRYVEVSGFPGTLTAENITGEVVSSLRGGPQATLVTSSELINKMWRLGIWGQKSNFLSVPTDCPQRDERLGWMADAAVFWRTGSYNYDIASFTHKWMRDVRDSQSAAGAFSNVSPNIGVGEIEGAPGWGDAGVMVPWTTWIQYGDPDVVEANWEAMERWMDFIVGANPDYIRRHKVGPDFADWLAPDPTTPRDLVDTAYWALIADMMTQMASSTGKTDAARKYADLRTAILNAFRQQYVKPDGTVGSGSQTSYVVALYMKLLPPELEAPAMEKLVKNIEDHGWHLTTGFLGTPYILFALANHGRADVAYRLLLNDTYPSWGYMIAKGATTWWERWNGDTGDPAMNSYNHYAFGSVVAWVYQNLIGIDTTSSGPGFHEITVQVHPDKSVSAARGEYRSVYGRVATEWSATPEGRFDLKVSVPANTTARVIVPERRYARILQDGKQVTPQEKDGERYMLVGSGTYQFQMN